MGDMYICMYKKKKNYNCCNTHHETIPLHKNMSVFSVGMQTSFWVIIYDITLI